MPFITTLTLWTQATSDFVRGLMGGTYSVRRSCHQSVVPRIVALSLKR